MERINPEPFGLRCSLFTDEFVRVQAIQRLEPASKVVGAAAYFQGLHISTQACFEASFDASGLGIQTTPLSFLLTKYYKKVRPKMYGFWPLVRLIGKGQDFLFLPTRRGTCHKPVHHRCLIQLVQGTRHISIKRNQKRGCFSQKPRPAARNPGFYSRPLFNFASRFSFCLLFIQLTPCLQCLSSHVFPG